MEVIKVTPAKQWKLLQEIRPDGTKIVHTGKWINYSVRKRWGSDGSEGYLGLNQDKAASWEARWVPIEVEEVDNFIFKAKIAFDHNYRGRSAGVFVFKDEDGIHKYETGMSGIEIILHAVASKIIPIIDGYFDFKWTFKKQGSAYYLYPVIDTEDDDVLE